MATTVLSRGITQVKKITVGRPVRRVNQDVGTINNIAGVNTEGAQVGSLLIFNPTTGDFEASILLEEQQFNGGQY